MHPLSLQPFKGILPNIGAGVYIADSARVIGDVTLGKDCSVWPMAVIRGDVNTITIGANSSVQDNVVLHCTHKSASNPAGYPLTIGKGVTIGHSAVLHGCAVGNNILIGIQATILDGAVIEDDVMIAAGSLVPPKARLKQGFLYKGAPAKASRALSADEIEFLRYNANNYIKLKNDYLNTADTAKS